MAATRPFYCYPIAFSTSNSVGSRATPSVINLIRLSSTQDCWVTIGITPVASVGGVGGAGVGSFLLRASTAGEFFSIYEGEHVAAVSAGTNGTLSIMEIT